MNLKADQQEVTNKMNREFKALQAKYPQYYFDITVERQQIGSMNLYACKIRAMHPGPADKKTPQA